MRAYLRAVVTLAGKDAILERRSLETVTATASFTLLVAVLFHFGFDIRSAEGSRFSREPFGSPFFFAGTIGMARSARGDEIDGRGFGAGAGTISRGAIYLGKFLFHLALMLLVEAVAVPVFIAAFTWESPIRGSFDRRADLGHVGVCLPGDASCGRHGRRSGDGAFVARRLVSAVGSGCFGRGGHRPRGDHGREVTPSSHGVVDPPAFGV